MRIFMRRHTRDSSIKKANTTYQYKKGGITTMARCPHLDYESNSSWGNSNDKYICNLCGKKMDTDDSIVKHTCNPDYGDEYKECSIYKDKS